MSDSTVIKEIVCLKSIELSTGRPRVLKPGDMDGALWERQVEAALQDPKSYEIHRETILTEEEEAADLSKVELREMFNMSREKVAIIAHFYGIKEEGQNRSSLIDQIAEVKTQQEEVARKYGIQQPAAGSEPITT